MLPFKTRPYITAQEIEKMCIRLGAEISRDYQGKDVLFVCILKGSLIFFADLIRHITIPLKVDFVRLSSYGHGTESSGNVKVLKDVSQDVRGKNIIIVEDILDTGNTLDFFKRHLEVSSPASVKICTLLDKPSRRKVKIEADYTGRSIEDKFVVGYGLDYQEKCRNYPDILFVEQ
jgi:hypoxanthine phosphoribosyltransferase